MYQAKQSHALLYALQYASYINSHELDINGQIVACAQCHGELKRRCSRRQRERKLWIVYVCGEGRIASGTLASPMLLDLFVAGQEARTIRVATPDSPYEH